jgi:hypothetical protein
VHFEIRLVGKINSSENMATGEEQRQQLIQKAVARGAGKASEVALGLWQPLTCELVSIIGEGGFDTLFARSLHLTHASFPWLAPGERLRLADFRLAEFAIRLDGQSAGEASRASYLLLQTFTDILASLIGEPLTTGILNSAWDDRALDPDATGKEFPHE